MHSCLIRCDGLSKDKMYSGCQVILNTNLQLIVQTVTVSHVIVVKMKLGWLKQYKPQAYLFYKYKHNLMSIPFYLTLCSLEIEGLCYDGKGTSVQKPVWEGHGHEWWLAFESSALAPFCGLKE